MGPLLVLAPRTIWVILLVLYGLAAAWRFWRRGRLDLPRGIAALAVLPLLGYAALSIAWTPVTDNALRQIVELLGFFLSAFGLAGLLPHYGAPVLRRLDLAVAAAVILGLATLTIEVVFDQPLYRLVHGMDVTATPSDAVLNRPAVLFAAFAWPAALHLRRRGLSWAAIVLLGATTAVLVVSSSQSASLGMVAGLMMFGLASLSLTWARRTVAAALAIACFGAVPIADGLYSAGAAQWDGLGITARHRVEIWHFTAERVGDRPIFGHGLAASRSMDNRGETSEFQAPDQSIIPLHPHNAFLQVWLELGLVGAVAAMAFGLAVLRLTATLAQTAQRMALAQFAASLAMLSVAYGAWQSWWVAGLLSAGLATALAARVPDRSPPESA